MRILVTLILLSMATPAFSAVTLDQLVVKGQKAAWAILQETEADSLDLTLLADVDAREQAQAFYAEHRDALLAESLKTPIELVARNENGACGQTGREAFANVTLSREACIDKLDSVGAVARLLVGEYTHHLNKGDQFTDWIKGVVVDTWRKNNPDAAKELFAVIDPYAPDDQVKLKDILGDVFVTPNVESPEMFVVLHDGKLTFTAPKKMSETVELIMITQSQVFWNESKKAFVTTGEWNITGYENRYWGQGLYERYPVWFQRNFAIEFQVIQNGTGIRMTYELPVRVDTQRNDVVMNRVTKSYLRNPGKEVFDALFKTLKQ